MELNGIPKIRFFLAHVSLHSVPVYGKRILYNTGIPQTLWNPAYIPGFNENIKEIKSLYDVPYEKQDPGKLMESR